MAITLDRIRDNDVVVGVAGLGYVGYPLALAFAEVGIKVLGFDTDENKITMINQGEGYFRHLNHDRLKKAVDAGLMSATSDFTRAAECDAILICVPTPLDAHLQPDLHYIEDTCNAIAPHLQPNTLVSLESTTWPGTTREVMKPLLENNGRLTSGKDLHLCFSPEREDPGNANYNTKNIPKLVGADDATSLELAVALYKKSLDNVVAVSGSGVAESAKLFENIFRSVNIALVNEMKMILDEMDIDVWEVIEAASTKPFGFMPFWPGPGLGGHCIPIDPFYLSWKARSCGVNTRFIELAGEINRAMPSWVVGKVQDCLNHYSKAVKGSRILVLGLSYKEDIDDMRESPSLELLSLLKEKGADIAYHDPFIKQLPATRAYTHLSGMESQEMSSDYDCFLVATKHSCFKPEEILSFGVPVVDTRKLFTNQENVFQA